MQPIIILCYPQLAENIGMVARAMMNFGLSDLRLVAPRDGWEAEQHNRAFAAASGHDDVLRDVQIFPDLPSAIADLQYVYATSPRQHDMVKQTQTSRTAMGQIHAQITQQGWRVGVLFGPERTGLVNEDISRADEIILIPTDPQNYSLNLAQAVLVIAYDWFCASQPQAERSEVHFGKTQPAARGDLLAFIERLEGLLTAADFYKSPEMKPAMQHNLRAAFTRAMLTDQEIRTLHGVLTALRGQGLGA